MAPTEDVAIATFRTQSGLLVNTVIPQVSAGRKNRLWLELDGVAGSAVFDQEQPESIWPGTDRGTTVLLRGEGSCAPDQARSDRIAAVHSEGWSSAFDSFVADTYAAIGGASPEGLPTVRDGQRSVQRIDALLASAATGT